MNPDRIYSHHRDDALARNVGAKDYTTFVAMPFTNSFSYRFQSILDDVIRASAKIIPNPTGVASPTSAATSRPIQPFQG